MCRELWNFCWSYRFYETKSQRCNVRNSILFSYSVIFNVLSEGLIMDEFGGNSFFGLGELEELYEWIMSMYIIFKCQYIYIYIFFFFFFFSYYFEIIYIYI